MAATAFPYARVSVPSPVEPDLLRGPCLPRLRLARLSGARPARPLDGVIWPQAGKPRSPCRNGSGETFFPWAAPIPREPRKHAPAKAGVSPPPSSAVLRPCGCVVDRLRPDDRHRGRDGRGARTAKEKR